MSTPPPQNEQNVSAHPYRLEGLKLEADFMKHLASLNTGSIVLVVTFLEKLFKQPEATSLVGIALVSFILSTVGLILIHVMLVVRMQEVPWDEPLSKAETWLGIPAFVFAFGGFFVGISCLAVFAIINLY